MNKLTTTWLIAVVFAIAYLCLYFKEGDAAYLISVNVFVAAIFIINAIQASKEDNKDNNND